MTYTCMYVCKRQFSKEFSKEVILAYADLMQTTEASYPFKKVKLELIMVIKEIQKSSLKILMNQKYHYY